MKPDIFRKHIQDPGIFWNFGIFRTLSNIYNEVLYSEPSNIAYLESWFIQNLSIFRTQDVQYWESLKYSLHRTMCNLGTSTILAYLSPNIMRAQGILRNLSNMYNGLFFTEPCVTLVYSELRTYSEPCQISMMKNLFTTLFNPSIFRTVAYSRSKAYSEYCKTSITKYFIQNLV